jgi:biotin operon repressor
LNWTCSDKNPVYYNLSIFGDITFYKSGIYWNGSNISINVDGLAVGKYQYRLVIADINNLTADDSVYVTVVKDKPPAINITSPKYGSLVSGLLNITGTASDPDGKVTDVQLNLGGSAWFPANGTDNWFLVWDTWTMTPGWNTITARATDNFGVQNTTSIQVKIPVPPKYLPMVTILSPANNSQTIGIVQVKGTTSVKNGTINSVDYKVDNGAWSKATGTSSWSFDWDTRTYTNRTYVIHVRATDNLSATAEALLYLIVANPHPNNPPTITITSPKSMETVGMAIVIKGTASDPDGDNITVKVRIDNDPWQNATGNKDWKFNWNTVVKKNGNYTITARATDEHGASSDVSLTIKVENQGKPHQDTTSTTEDTVKSACYVIIVAATIAGTAAAGSYAFTDLGRWLRFRGLLMQMYSKRRDDKVLDNFIRGWVQGVVVRDPGIRPVDVIETFEGQYSGNLIYYHINELVRFGYVYMVQRNRNGQIVKVWKGDNGKVVENVHITDAEKATDFTVRNSTLLGLSLHLYPSDIMAPKSQLNLRKKQRFMVYKYLVQNPGRNQTEIADALDMVRQAVAYHLKELQKDGLLIVGTSGRAKYYYVDSGIGQKDVGLRAEVGPVQAPSNQLRTE